MQWPWCSLPGRRRPKRSIPRFRRLSSRWIRSVKSQWVILTMIRSGRARIMRIHTPRRYSRRCLILQTIQMGQWRYICGITRITPIRHPVSLHSASQLTVNCSAWHRRIFPCMMKAMWSMSAGIIFRYRQRKLSGCHRTWMKISIFTWSHTLCHCLQKMEHRSVLLVWISIFHRLPIWLTRQKYTRVDMHFWRMHRQQSCTTKMRMRAQSFPIWIPRFLRVRILSEMTVIRERRWIIPIKM